MIVTHNLSALNAQRQFGITTKNTAKTIEKLSSGYKINKASDDAAGLSISEKMRKQVRGLTQGVENVEAGVSLCQVADGALAEVHDMLQRMNELAIQSSNGTNSYADRQAIQEEINQLLTEIDRVGETTTFNGKQIFGNSEIVQDTGIIYNGWRIPAEIKERKFSFTYILDDPVIFDGRTYGKGDVISGTSLTLGEAYYFSPHNAYYCEQVVDGFSHSISLTPNAPRQDQSYPTYEKNGSYSLSLKDLMVDGDGHIYFDSKKYGQRHYLYSEIKDDTHPDEKSLQAINVGAETYKAEILVATRLSENDLPKKPTQYWIQSGCDVGDGIPLEIDGMNTSLLGIRNLDVSTMEGADSAIPKIGVAIAKLSANRSKIGAQQNRLEHTIANENNIIENTTTAESRIRDANLAEQMVQYSRDNILEQVGQSMMAQANQSTQSVLNLLQ